MIALIGANPVPLATRTIGLTLSSRKKKVPIGPSKRRISRSFTTGCTAPKSGSVNLPPGMCRTCSSTWSAACGAPAIE